MLRLCTAGVLLAGFLYAQTPAAPPPKPPPFFKGDKKKEDSSLRMLEGTVKGEDDNAIDGAVVKIKDLKSLGVRSYITKTDGKYSFQGLRKDVDYEVRADHQGGSSPSKTLSVFDARSEVVINLKVEPKKK